MTKLHKPPSIPSLVSSLSYKNGPSNPTEIDVNHHFIIALKNLYPEKFLQLLDKPCDMSKLDSYISGKNMTVDAFDVIDFIKHASNTVGDIYFNTSTNTMMIYTDKFEWVALT